MKLSTKHGLSTLMHLHFCVFFIQKRIKDMNKTSQFISNKAKLIAITSITLATLLTTACGTVTGAAVGAGAGAAVGAGTGHGAKKGALIGTGIGAAVGAVYDITK